MLSRPHARKKESRTAGNTRRRWITSIGWTRTGKRSKRRTRPFATSREAAPPKPAFLRGLSNFHLVVRWQMSDKRDSHSARRVPFEGMSKSDAQWQEGGRTVTSGTWSSITCPNFRIRFPSFLTGTRAKHDRRWTSFETTSRVHVFHTVKSSSGWYALVCEHVCREKWNQLSLL